MKDIPSTPPLGQLNRRDLLAVAAVTPTLFGGSLSTAAPNAASSVAGTGLDQAADELFAYLAPLRQAVHELSNTWRPEDPRYRAETFRQIMMNLSYSYFAYFHADAEHPDWAPLWNPVYTCQPNPDDIYLYCPLRSDLTYRISGNRGTVKRLIFVAQHGLSGMVDDLSEIGDVTSLDDTDMKLAPDSEFELLLSATRPAGHSGHWMQLKPRADVLFVRYRSWDWANDRDPQLTIECLDAVPPKKHLTPEEIIERIKLMAQFPVRTSKVFLAMQNAVKRNVGLNRFEPVRMAGLTKQVYWPAVFQFDDGEALIIETDLPKVRPYWNIQLNDPLFNAIEYVYRLSSFNGATAHISSDGKLRAVLALQDPGVPNWLDTAGYTEGTIYGRWYDCDSTPTPTIKRVPLAKVREHLPRDTPVVTPTQRAEELRRRIRAAQRRRRW